MTQPLLSLSDRFARLRARRIAPIEKRLRTLRIVRRRNALRGTRSNPELRETDPSAGLARRLIVAWHNRRVQRRWQRELAALDERLLRDAGISRHDFASKTRRPGVWI